MLALVIDPVLLTADVFVALSFLWLPLVFAAYAIGRKQFGIRFMLIAMTVEAVALVWGINSLRRFF